MALTFVMMRVIVASPSPALHRNLGDVAPGEVAALPGHYRDNRVNNVDIE
ncbi:hypothetical protein [Tepidiforma sp.]|nr:hypothetical protein [Tepidiforma sp.]